MRTAIIIAYKTHLLHVCLFLEACYLPQLPPSNHLLIALFPQEIFDSISANPSLTIMPPQLNFHPATMVSFTTKSSSFWLPVQLDVSDKASISLTQSILRDPISPCLDSQTRRSMNASSLAITFVWKGYGPEGDDVETIIDSTTPFATF